MDDRYRGRLGRRTSRLVVLAIAWTLAIAAAMLAWRGIGPGRDPELPTYADTGSSALAALAGALTRDGECVLVADYEVVWPAGYELRGPELVDPHGNVVARLGDVVQLAGGEAATSETVEAPNSRLKTPIPAACRSHHVWIGSPKRPSG